MGVGILEPDPLSGQQLCHIPRQVSPFSTSLLTWTILHARLILPNNLRLASHTGWTSHNDEGLHTMRVTMIFIFAGVVLGAISLGQGGWLAGGIIGFLMSQLVTL